MAFWIVRHGQRVGPFDEAEVLANFESGALQADDLLAAGDGPATVTVREVFAHFAGARANESGLALVPDDGIERDRARAAGADPYRAPAAPLERPEEAAPYGGFWARLAAAYLDGLVVLVTAGLLFWMFRGPNVAVIVAVFAWLYFAGLEGSARGATFGKRVMRLRVVSARSGEAVGFLRATGRFFGRSLSAVVLYAGYLMQPFTARRQALHDMVSGTLVVSEGRAARGTLAAVAAAAVVVPLAVGVVASLVVPVYQERAIRESVSEALLASAGAVLAVETYIKREGKPPESMADLGFSEFHPSRGLRALSLAPRTGILTLTLDVAPLRGQTVVLIPRLDGSTVRWVCGHGTVPVKYLPTNCPFRVAGPAS